MTRSLAHSMAFLAAFLAALLLGATSAEAGQAPLYYQDPDGKPFYAAGPQKTPDGREFKPVYEDASPVAPATTEPPAGRGRIVYYRNPMGAPDTSPVPKKDSMGMDYIPVYENEAADAGVVTVPAGRLQLLGVRTAPVEKRGSVIRTVRATGTVQFDERHLAVITTRAAGWIEHLHVAATGDPVRKGEVVADVYSPELAAAEEEYLVAARMAGSQGDMAHVSPGILISASLKRLQALNVPDDEISRLQRTGRASRFISVQARENGVVTDKLAIEGMRVNPDEPLYRTAALDPIWLIADVQEQDLGSIRPGQKAEVELVAFPGRQFAGTADFIYPSLTAETRTARVRIVMPNADLALRAGMYATVSIEAPAVASGPILAVPASAIIDSGTQQVVLVVKGEGRFEPRKIKTGSSGNGFIEVTEGVADGDQVVVGANFLLDSESNLRAALQAFTVPKEQGQGGHSGSSSR